jgi:hypothetical protein
MKERDRRAEKEKTQRLPLEITLYMNDHIVPLDSNNSPTLTKQPQSALSEKATKVDSLQDKAKIQIRVPKTKRHHRH